METTMLQPHANDPWADFRQLSPEQWERRKQRLIQRAREARAQAIGDLARRLGRAVRNVAERGADLVRSFASRTAVMASRWASGYAAWRERRRALRELAALDDRMLRDIGVSRSEIESAVYGRDPTRLRDATIAANRRQRWPAAGAGMSAKPQQSVKDAIKKRAA
jgi:uncharacterized protein YjiS (DUF1127 family)